jgi:hypothetical protein
MTKKQDLSRVVMTARTRRSPYRINQLESQSMKPLLIIAAALLFAGCTDRAMANFSALGEAHIVKLYAADGHVIQEWTSTGKVGCTEGGICDFMDANTRKLVRTTGDIVVTVK